MYTDDINRDNDNDGDSYQVVKYKSVMMMVMVINGDFNQFVIFKLENMNGKNFTTTKMILMMSQMMNILS